MSELNITKEEAYVIADHIDLTLIQAIRNDKDIDLSEICQICFRSLEWLINMIHGYEKLCEYSGYNYMTEPDLKTDEEENNDDKRAF